LIGSGVTSVKGIADTESKKRPMIGHRYGLRSEKTLLRDIVTIILSWMKGVIWGINPRD
jgi:hypothetical protein